MGTLMCPLCCEDEFKDQLALRYHLLSMIANVYCPQCSRRFDSILQLAKHLDGMCGTAEDELELESYSDKENKINVEHYTQEFGTDMNTVKILSHENCKEKETSISVRVPDIQETQLIEVTALGMDTSSTDVLVPDFTNSCSQVIECSENSTFLNDLRDVEEPSEDMEDESMMICDSSDMKSADISEQQEYSCSFCDITFTSVAEHIRIFHRGQEVAVKVMDNDKAVWEKLVDVGIVGPVSSGRGDEKLSHVEERISKDSSAVLVNVTEEKLAVSQLFPQSKENTVAYHEEKVEQTSRYLTIQDKFNKKFKSGPINNGRKFDKDVNLIISGEPESESKIQRMMKYEGKSIEKLFSGSDLVKKNTNILSELYETIVNSPEMEEEVSTSEVLINNTISIFTCTSCQTEFGNVSMFNKHSCPWSNMGTKSMKTVCLKPETFENPTYSNCDTEDNSKLQLVVQVVKCNVCSMIFNKMGAFRKHLKEHNTHIV